MGKVEYLKARREEKTAEKELERLLRDYKFYKNQIANVSEAYIGKGHSVDHYQISTNKEAIENFKQQIVEIAAKLGRNGQEIIERVDNEIAAARHDSKRKVVGEH